MNKKQIVRINESQLRQIVTESVKRVIKESAYDNGFDAQADYLMHILKTKGVEEAVKQAEDSLELSKAARLSETDFDKGQKDAAELFLKKYTQRP